MAIATPEIRSAVMIMVDISWRDTGGGLVSTRARMEDKSASGACIRSKKSFAPGSRLKIQWRFEQFSGIVKYCRSEAHEYVIGIQRAAANEDSEPLVSPRPASPLAAAPPIASKVPDPLEQGTANRPPVYTTPPSASPRVSEPPPQTLRRRVNARDGPRMPGQEVSEVPSQTELRRERAPQRDQTGEGRKSMANKWFSRAPWIGTPDASIPDGGEGEKGAEVRGPGAAKEHFMSQAKSPEKPPAISAREVPAFQVELLPMEDIYSTAGIATSRKGYSVTKLVDMINSEHIRGLPRETKRAAILMALEAAGVSLEQVQRDAKSRQNALETYEVEQKKQAEAEWSRKAEEITGIQAELESIKAHYTARINRNMEALAGDKARFKSWVTTKEQESQSMSDAIELCMKPDVSEPSGTPAREAAIAASAASGAKVFAGK